MCSIPGTLSLVQARELTAIDDSVGALALSLWGNFPHGVREMLNSCSQLRDNWDVPFEEPHCWDGRMFRVITIF